MYSIQTLYLGNSPPCADNIAIDKLAYNNIPPDENNKANNLLFQKMANETRSNIANNGL